MVTWTLSELMRNGLIDAAVHVATGDRQHAQAKAGFRHRG